MREFWDEAARKDALFHVDDRGLRGDEFWAGGEEAVRLFEQHLDFDATGRRLVDVGCGVGRLTRVLAQRAERVAAIDVSSEMLDRAREYNPQLDNVDWIHGDGTSLAGIADGWADGVFSHVVFQHIPDPEITLGYVDEIGRVLQPGGWAAFQISNDPQLHERAAEHDPAWRGSWVDLEELRTRADAAGMAVERVVGEGTQYCLVRLSRA